MRALLIDDSRAMRMILRRALDGLGFEITEAGDGAEGLQKLRWMPVPDLILVDWNMPKLNGFQFLTIVRRDPKYDAVKIVMVTTEVEIEQVSRAITAGASEYIMKPFTPDIVREKLGLLGLVEEAT